MKATLFYRRQMAITFALTALIPLLTFVYFLSVYVFPFTVTRENVFLIVLMNIFLAVCGFLLLADEIAEKTRGIELSQYNLQASETRYRRLFEAARDGILMLDAETGQIVDVNTFMVELLGYSREEFLDRKLWETGLFKDIAQSRAVFNELNEKGYLHYEDLPLKTKDGRRIQAEFVSHVCQVDNKKVIQCNIRDITERKQAKETLRDTNKRLEAALNELKRTQSRIIQQERLSALGQMASGIAHDFNNALMPILGLSDYLISYPETLSNPKETRTLLEQIRTAGNDAREIVQRLREVYRPRDDTEYHTVDMATLITSAISLTKSRWQEEMNAKGVRIDVLPEAGENLKVSGNEAELREVLTNLILNSVDAMPHGGTITIRSRRDNDRVITEVADTGTGMTDEQLNRCFEPFFTTKGARGTGLGLSIIHGIVERYDGSVAIQSEPGKGTTVTILLHAEESTAKEEEAPAGAISPVRSLRVLVIDDDPRARDLVTRFLTADKHIVETASSGREGLDKFRQADFDLVVTDRAMPDMSGDQVALALKDIKPGIPVILLTGFGYIMKEKGERPPGATLVFSKPVTRQELRYAIAKVME